MRTNLKPVSLRHDGLRVDDGALDNGIVSFVTLPSIGHNRNLNDHVDTDTYPGTCLELRPGLCCCAAATVHAELQWRSGNFDRSIDWSWQKGTSLPPFQNSDVIVHLYTSLWMLKWFYYLPHLKLIDWFIDWLIDRLIDRLIGIWI